MDTLESDISTFLTHFVQMALAVSKSRSFIAIRGSSKRFIPPSRDQTNGYKSLENIKCSIIMCQLPVT